MISKITGGNVSKLFNSKILNKYDVQFYKCDETGFIQTENPYWLNESYESAITNLDLGLVERNLNLSKSILSILLKYFYDAKIFLDYGGGYGLFVRMMRDKGFNFFNFDIYCDNIFAKNLSIPALANTELQFDVITAFEVFEHLVNPIDEIELLFKHTDTIIFSTELVPNQNFNNANDWWYFSPSTGQHISFYTKKSLEFIATKFDCNLFTNDINLHILTKNKFKSDPFLFLNKVQKFDKKMDYIRRKFFRLNNSNYKKLSLMGFDTEQVKPN